MKKYTDQITALAFIEAVIIVSSIFLILNP